MNVEQLVKWVMEQDVNWMANLAPIASGKNNANFFVAQNQRGISQYEFNNALRTIVNQPPLPKGEWFTPTTKHVYCTDCGRWVAVEHSPYHNIICGKCGYCVATYSSVDFLQPTWGADGDTEEYVWVASKGRYEHVEDLGSDLPLKDEDEPTPAYTSEGEDYPTPLKPEWVRACPNCLQPITDLTGRGNYICFSCGAFAMIPAKPVTPKHYFATLGGWE